MHGFTSIIILSYNTLDLIQLCIESIRSFTDYSTYEIIVVENASTDGSVEWLQQQTDIKCIFNSENAGFPKGCNQGMKIARGDSILLLNSDTIVTPRWLEQLKTALYSSDDIGAVSCVTNKCTNYQMINVPYTDINDMLSFAEEFNHTDSNKWVESFRLVGFCMLFKREIYDNLGGLDEIFTPGNFEDDDYSLRIRLAGYRLLLCQDTFIHHFGSASFLKIQTTEEEQIHRINFIRLGRRNTRKFCHKWNVPNEFNTLDNIVWYFIEKLVNNERVLFIGSYSMTELMIIHKYNPTIKLEYITDNELDWKSNTTYLKQYNCVDIMLEASKYISGEYDFIVIDDGIIKYDKPLDFIHRLKNYVKDASKLVMRKYDLIKIKNQIRTLNAEKIAFITMVNNEDKYAKALTNWKTLHIPRDMKVEYIAIRDAISMTDGNNKAMVQSDAKYKIYVHQDVFFENKNFLKILINSFKKNPRYGIAGVVGCVDLPVNGIWWQSQSKIGGIRDTDSVDKTPTRHFYQDKLSKPMIVSGLDGIILATQYDIPWRSDLFDRWYFYDMSQCMEFKRNGYEAIVLPQLDVLCFHDCGISSLDGYDQERNKFLQEYIIELSDIPYLNVITGMNCDEFDYRNRLYTPTMINKIGDFYFIVDCWHGRVIYSDKLDKPILAWKTLADDIAAGHTIASDGEFYLIDDSENNAVRVFKCFNGVFSEVQRLEIQGRPHYVLYDEMIGKFYVVLSNLGAIAVCCIKKGKVCVEYTACIVDVRKTPCYIRSISIIDGYMYMGVQFYSASGSIYKIKVTNNYWKIVDETIIPNNISGLNYICKIQDYFYITVYTTGEFELLPKIMRCKKISDIPTGKYEILNDVVGLQGTPYFINKFDGHYFMTEIDQYSGIKSFEVIDNQIVNVKEVLGWTDIVDASIKRKNNIFNTQ